MINVAELSEANLRKALLDRGFNAGPIVATTRSTYEKKLLSLMALETTDVDSGDHDLFKVNDNIGTTVIEEVPVKIYPTLEVEDDTVRQRRPAAPIEQDTVEEEPSDDEGHEFSRLITEEELQHELSQRSVYRGAQQPKRNIGKFLVLLAIICGGVFLFYFADNISKLTAMDSDDSI